jgi:uncharacterized protein YacL
MGFSLQLIPGAVVGVLIFFRPEFIIGPFLMGLCMIVVASMLVRYSSPHFNATTQSVDFNFVNTAAGNTAVAFMFLYMMTFSASIAALTWTYQNEVFSINARGRGTTLSTSTNWFINFWLGLYIRQALNFASWKLYYVFGAINISISVVTFLFYPEPCKRSLEEMDLLLTPYRRKLVSLDNEACRKGSMLEHGLESGSAAAKELESALVMSSVQDGDLEKQVAHEEEFAG